MKSDSLRICMLNINPPPRPNSSIYVFILTKGKLEGETLEVCLHINLISLFL